MNNRWNKWIYRLWAPFYDKVFNAGPFARAKKEMFSKIALRPHQRVLLVGVGTGADLPFLYGKQVQITAVDLSAAMLAQAKRRVSATEQVNLMEMDAQKLQFADQSFDLVVASLILSVVPDANRCMAELVRVTKKQGRMMIFDKFKTSGKKLPLGKRLLRPLIALFGTDISRDFAGILEPYREQVILREDSPAMFGDMYRRIVLERNA
jgi:ubiquinone/menaquinone biosynthesis C-methylase UbiE